MPTERVLRLKRGEESDDSFILLHVLEEGLEEGISQRQVILTASDGELVFRKTRMLSNLQQYFPSSRRRSRVALTWPLELQ